MSASGLLRLYRSQPGQYGWAITTASGTLLEVHGSLCHGLTRWEARQTLGLLGLAYSED